MIKEKENQVGGLPLEDFFLGWFDGRTALYLCSTLFNKKHLEEIGGFYSKTNLFQDVVAEFKLAGKFGRIDIPEVKASFRRHDETITHTARVKDWCEDSILLLDLINSLSRERKDMVNSKGRYYLAQTNYRRANFIQSLPKRVSAYFLVYRMFDFSHLPKSSLVLRGRKLTGFSRLKNLVNLGEKE